MARISAQIVLPTIALATLAAPSLAQSVVAIPAATVPMSSIDFDALPVGSSDVAAINAAGTGSSGARLRSLTLTRRTGQSSGTYNTAVDRGRALALSNGGLEIIDNDGTAAFDAFDTTIELRIPATEFGLRISDFNGSIDLQFFEGSIQTASITTASFRSPGIQFFSYTPSAGSDGFDRVVITRGPGSGNWVLTELEIQNGGFPGASAAPVASTALATTLIDFDTMPLGVVSPNSATDPILNAAQNGRAPINVISFQASSANDGTYDTNTAFGQALARVGGRTTIIDNSGNAQFEARNYAFDLRLPGRIFGFRVGDANATFVVEFFERGVLTATTEIRIDGQTQEPVLIEYVPSIGGRGYDRVGIRPRTGSINFVLTELLFPAPFESIGDGCIGSGGRPTLTVQTDRPRASLRTEATNLAPATTVGTAVVGLQRFAPAIDLSILGAPGCFLFIDPILTATFPVANGQGRFTFQFPQVPDLRGIEIFEQVVDFDPPANALGLTTSNAIRSIVQS